MSVKKKSIRDMDKFIEKGAAVKASKDRVYKKFIMRVPVELAERMDTWIKEKTWLNRTQWIIETISERLKSGE